MRLVDLDFADIILSPRKGWVRGLSGNQTYQRINSEFDDDAASLFEKFKMEEEKCKDYEFSVYYEGFWWRVSVLQSEKGKQYVARKGQSSVPDLGNIGLHTFLYQQLTESVPKSGLIIVCGPQGAGKTTTASSVVTTLASRFHKYIVTIEDPPELPLEGEYPGGGLVFQTKAPRVTTQDSITTLWAVSVERAMRYGRPDALFIGEIRNAIALSHSVRAALSGTLVICTMHGSSIQDALTQCISWMTEYDGQNYGASRFADALEIIVHQDLVQMMPNKKSLKTEFLMLGGKDGLRNKIRTGTIAQIGTDINTQMNNANMLMRFNASGQSIAHHP